MTEGKKEVAAKKEKVKLEISKTKLIWICVIVIIVLAAVLIFFAIMMWGGIQNLEQATETMTDVSSDIGRISSILEDIATSLG